MNILIIGEAGFIGTRLATVQDNTDFLRHIRNILDCCVQYSAKKIKRDLNWAPKTSLNGGLKKILDSL